MTAPTQQEALAMARDAGIPVSKDCEYEPCVANQSEIHALVAMADARAYKRGVEDAAMIAFCMEGASGQDIADAIRNRSKT